MTSPKDHASMYHTMLSRIVSCLASLFMPALLIAEEWPEFRGPDAQGHYAGKLPTTWSETKNVAWSVDLPGQGWSSPVIVADKIYLTAAVPGKEKSYSLRCLCLNTQDGKTFWNTEIFAQPPSSPGIHSKNSHASPTPVVKDGRIYVHFGHLGLACLDTAGKILWKNNDYPYKPVHGNGGSPCITQETLIFSVDGTDMQSIIGLDIHSGKERWKTDRHVECTKHFSFGTPLVITVNGKEQVISVGSEVVMALDPYNGKEIWRASFKGYSQIPRPIYSNGLVYICTGYDSPKLLAIKPDGQGDVTKTHIAWTVPRSVPNTPSPIIVGDALYMVSDFSVMSCLDARTGEQRWQGRLSGGYSASLLEADGKIYAMNEKGVCSVVEAGPKFVEISKNALPGRTLATPAPYQGMLFIRTDEKLFCIKTAP